MIPKILGVVFFLCMLTKIIFAWLPLEKCNEGTDTRGLCVSARETKIEFQNKKKTILNVYHVLMKADCSPV